MGDTIGYLAFMVLYLAGIAALPFVLVFALTSGKAPLSKGPFSHLLVVCGLALAAVAVCFGVSFFVAGRHELPRNAPDDWVEGALAVALVIVCSSLAFASARQLVPEWSPVAAIVVAVAAWFALFFGEYTAYRFEWQGLDSADYGSEDFPGISWLWVTSFLLSPIPIGFGTAVAVISNLTRKRSPAGAGLSG